MFSLFSRRARYTRKKYQKDSPKSLMKIFFSTLLTVGITSSIIYAATLTTVMNQTISQWDTIWAGWYQSVNDKLAGLFSSGGNVWIGIASTVDSLHVTRSAADSQYIWYFDATNSNNYGMRVNIANTTSNRPILDLQAGWVTKLYFWWDGNMSVSGTISAATPTSSGQLATKWYVDSAIAGASGGGPCVVNIPWMICSGNTIYAFRIGLTTNYMTTPGWCTDSTTPTCAGGYDTVWKTWWTYGVTTGRTSTSDGQGNSVYLAANYSDTYAAKFCEDMVYAWYSDWFLPSKDELALLYQNRTLIGWFISNYYWSSTEYDSMTTSNQAFSTLGDIQFPDKRTTYKIRCVRKF